MNKWLAAAGLALVILMGAMGLQGVVSNMHNSTPVHLAGTSAPVPPTPY